MSVETRSSFRQSRNLWQQRSSGRLLRRAGHFGGQQFVASASDRRAGSDPREHGESQESEKAQGSIGRAVGGNTGSEQRTQLWSKALRSRRSRHFGASGANDEREGASETRRSTAAEGKASEGTSACAEGWSSGGNVGGQLETRRTSWSVAGCNRPATLSVEQTVGVVRNGKGGTCSKVWQPLGLGQPGVDTQGACRRRGVL